MTWVRELSKDSAGKLQPIEDRGAFKIPAAVTDIDDLAAAIAAKPFIAKREPTGPLKVFKLNAAAEWEKIEVDELVQPNGKNTAYGFIVPQ